MEKYLVDGISRGVGAPVRITLGKVTESRRYVYDIDAKWERPSPPEFPDAVIDECVKVSAKCIQLEAGETVSSSVEA